MRLDEARRDLAALSGLEVVLYGSSARGEATPRSDIDVAVVTRRQDRGENEREWLRLLGQAPDRYDIRVFELLPLPVQMNVVKDAVVVFGDAVELSAYFYGFRRRWRDVRPRYLANQFRTLSEKRAALAANRRRP